MDRSWVEDGDGEHGINEIMSFGTWKKRENLVFEIEMEELEK